MNPAVFSRLVARTCGVVVPGEELERPTGFGRALREARQHKGLPQVRLGRMVGYSKGHLSKIENGRVAVVGLEVAELFDRTLGAGGRLTEAFLADEPADVPSAGPLAAAGPFDVPPPPGHFVGRDAEIARIAGAIRGQAKASRAPVVLIHGMPGVGKTALALRVAHLARDWYRDGCLYVDFGDGQGPAGSVHGRLLRRLGVPAGELPPEPEEARSRYLSEVCRRDVLIVADGVISAGQVAALVPASSGCAVIATSRRRLDALDDCLPLLVGPLADDDAADLLRAVSGRNDLGSDADVRRLATACGGLPLALRIAAVKARGSRRGAARLADLLERPATTWRQLDDGERSVQRTLRDGCGALPDSSRRTLAALALHPAEAVASHPAAWLAGSSPETVEDDFAELAAHGLVTVDTDGRARPHALVRALAAGTSVPAGQEALRRLIAGYARTAMAADGALVPQRFRPHDTDGDITVAPLSFGDPARAMAWCRAEAGIIPQLCSLALERGLYEECWRLAYAMRDYFFAARALRPWTESHRVALLAAERRGDHWARAVTRSNLGMAYVEQGRIAEAQAQYGQALELLRAQGNHCGVAATLGHQAWASHAAGRHDAAIALAGEAMKLHREHDNQRSVAIMCRTAALAHSAAGRHDNALDLLDECDEILSGFGLVLDLAMTLNCRGEVRYATGHYDEAAALHDQAAEHSEACGGTGELARAVRGKAAALAAVGGSGTT
jgi:tetratricopeptide (TPR) repeat protein/transcriptional regulator with XRE-family HTH domain